MQKGTRYLFWMEKGMKDHADCTSFELGVYRSRVDERLASWTEQKFVQRLWDKDHTLWSAEPVTELIDRLGWLTLPELEHDVLDDAVAFAENVRSDGFTHVVLLGMGGSSLAPEVFAKSFGSSPGYPELTVLDSTHPEAVRNLEDRLPLSNTLYCVSSKSGTTLETLSLFRYFWNKVKKISEEPGDHFVAITDPGSPLESLAKERRFRKVFASPPDVGGRYSALTVFGLVPAVLIGVDIHKLLDRARKAAEKIKSIGSKEDSAGVVLGATLGELSTDRNKITLMTTRSLNSFSDWVEQLVAESTGKEGKGILPVVNEPIGLTGDYSKDRLFIGLFLEGEKDQGLEMLFDGLSSLGHPVVRIHLKDIYDLGREFFHWEVAVAAAGAVMGINPFDQPDVQLAKDFTKRIMGAAKVSEIGNGTTETPEPDSHEVLEISDHEFLSAAMESWISQAHRGDYVALQAFLQPNPATKAALQRIRKTLLNRTQLATTLGFGPRFLHSTGQLHKGGPNTGLFIQLMDNPGENCDVPETDLSFDQIIHAQANGDYLALLDRKRRILRINLQDNAIKGLERLQKLISL
jgi:transaldolase/glucose-6-phosphate isomerase